MYLSKHFKNYDLYQKKGSNIIKYIVEDFYIKNKHLFNFFFF